MPELTDTACPGCQHPAHAPDVECEGGIDHGSKHWHRCLCLNRPGSNTSCHPLMDCQGGKLGYSDIWYLQRGHTLSSAGGPITPDLLTQKPAPVCKFADGCHRVVPCDPGCAPPVVVSGQTLRDRVAEAVPPLTEADRDEREDGPGQWADYIRAWNQGRAEVLAVLPPDGRAALEAERDSLGREADRLRKDWVEMRTRAERAEAERDAYGEQLDGGAETIAARTVEINRLTDELRRLAAAAPQPGQHVYLSTGCLHGQHTYCQNVDGIAGLKKPAQCKFCQTACICPCHAAVVRQEPGTETTVAYFHPDVPNVLLCRICGARPDLDVTPLASENLPNGGICTKCGVDVLIEPAASQPAAVVPVARAGQDEPPTRAI
ncbi:hypothetical protein ACFUEN_29100 [Streptomyces griseorubiginosus]|uniref:hypothetical protein n=1 Tax=Streptomyces griseorubiginosus TaxID=67304 RepID=UPI0036408E8F